MKKTKSKEKIEMIETLKSIIDQKKDLSKKEKNMKETVKAILGDDNALVAGDLVVIRSQRKRQTINKKKLEALLSEEEMKKVTDETSYEIIEIKAA